MQANAPAFVATAHNDAGLIGQGSDRIEQQKIAGQLIDFFRRKITELYFFISGR